MIVRSLIVLSWAALLYVLCSLNYQIQEMEQLCSETSATVAPMP